MMGKIADGVIFNFFPPARTRQAPGELAEGAKAAGRDPRTTEATLFATAFISDDLEAARRRRASCFRATGRCAFTAT